MTLPSGKRMQGERGKRRICANQGIMGPNANGLRSRGICIKNFRRKVRCKVLINCRTRNVCEDISSVPKGLIIASKGVRNGCRCNPRT